MTRITRTSSSNHQSFEQPAEINEAREVQGLIRGRKPRRIGPELARGPYRVTISSQITMTIIVRTSGRGRYVPLIDGRELRSSATPLLSAARALQAEGMPDDTLLEMIHEGSTSVSLRLRLGKAARLRVNETGGTPRFVPWRPDQLPSMVPSLVPLGGETAKRALSSGSHAESEVTP